MLVLESVDVSALPSTTNDDVPVTGAYRYSQFGPQLWLKIMQALVSGIRVDKRMVLCIVDCSPGTGCALKAFLQCKMKHTSASIGLRYFVIAEQDNQVQIGRKAAQHWHPGEIELSI